MPDRFNLTDVRGVSLCFSNTTARRLKISDCGHLQLRVAVRDYFRDIRRRLDSFVSPSIFRNLFIPRYQLLRVHHESLAPINRFLDRFQAVLQTNLCERFHKPESSPGTPNPYWRFFNDAGSPFLSTATAAETIVVFGLVPSP